MVTIWPIRVPYSSKATSKRVGWGPVPSSRASGNNATALPDEASAQGAPTPWLLASRTCTQAGSQAWGLRYAFASMCRGQMPNSSRTCVVTARRAG